MEAKYNRNNIVMNVLTKVYQVMVLNILFIIFSIPVLTIGASTRALVACIRDMFGEGLDREIRTYFSYFKEDFKRSTITFLVLLVGYVIVAINLIYINHTGYLIGLIQLPVLAQLLLTHAMLSIVLLEWDFSIKKSLKVAWILGNKYVIRTAGFLGISYLFLKLSLRIPVLITFFYIPVIAIIQYFFCYKIIKDIKGE